MLGLECHSRFPLLPKGPQPSVKPSYSLQNPPQGPGTRLAVTALLRAGVPGLLTQLTEGRHQVLLVFQKQLGQADLGGPLPKRGLVQDVPAQVGQHLGHIPLKVCGHKDHKAHVVLKGEVSHLQIKEGKYEIKKLPIPAGVWGSMGPKTRGLGFRLLLASMHLTSLSLHLYAHCRPPGDHVTEFPAVSIFTMGWISLSLPLLSASRANWEWCCMCAQ